MLAAGERQKAVQLQARLLVGVCMVLVIGIAVALGYYLSGILERVAAALQHSFGA